MSQVSALALGDYEEDYATLNFHFSTLRDDTGAPIVLAGSPQVSVYKGSATATEKTSAESYITLDIDFDSVVGLNHVLIDLSGDAFFATAEDYAVILTTGTVNGVSKTGMVLAYFSIENRSPLADVQAILADTVTLGSPAGASHAADNAAIKVDTAAVVVGTIDNATGADVATDVVALKAETVLILADTDDIGVAGAGLTDLGGMSTGMKAEVNVEAKDVLDTDTHGEPAQGAPGATVSTGAKIDWLYKAFRNRVTQTATQWNLYNNDAATIDTKATVSDNGTTADRNELVSGP